MTAPVYRGSPAVGHLAQWFVARPWRALTLILVFALSIRIATFGDPALHVDESFYMLVGEMMRHGAVPYVDVWDRKPFGLFALYFLFSVLHEGPLGYQVAAWLFAAATAFVIHRIALRFAGPLGSLLAAFVYLAALGGLMGMGGQAPVFYNLFVAIAFALVIASIEPLNQGRLPVALYVAMLSGGIALTIKQTSVFELGYLGLFAVFAAARAGVPLRRLVPATLGFILVGLLPSAGIALWYAQAGHWQAFYDAMVTANLGRPAPELWISLSRLGVMMLIVSPLAALAVASGVIAMRRSVRPPLFGFLLGWIAVACVGIAVVPNYYLHHALPLAVPLSIAAALVLDRPRLGSASALIVIGFFCWRADAFDFSWHEQTRKDMGVLAQAMAEHAPNGTALIFDGPPYLYAMSGLRPLSPLVFPSHLNKTAERRTSGIDAIAELQAVLAEGPGAIVIASEPRRRSINHEALQRVRDYAASQCRPVAAARIRQIDRDTRFEVFGDCEPEP